MPIHMSSYNYKNLNLLPKRLPKRENIEVENSGSVSIMAGERQNE